MVPLGRDSQKSIKASLGMWKFSIPKDGQSGVAFAFLTMIMNTLPATIQQLTKYLTMEDKYTDFTMTSCESTKTAESLTISSRK